MVCAIHLPGSAESLAWRPSNDNVNTVSSDQRSELIWLELPKIAFKRMRNYRQVGMATVDEVRSQRRNGDRIKIYGSEAVQTAAQQAERKSATPAKQIQESRRRHVVSHVGSGRVLLGVHVTTAKRFDHAPEFGLRTYDCTLRS